MNSPPVRLALLAASLGATGVLAACSDGSDSAGSLANAPAEEVTRARPVQRVAPSARCDVLEPISVGRVTSNLKARRVGSVVFTPLALSRSLVLVPYRIAGAPGAGAVKIGATVISGSTARVSISAPGGARLVYGAELLEKLATNAVSWSELPRTLVLVPCRNEEGRAVATGFPGGFVLRRKNTCVRLLVTNVKGRTVARTFPFGRARCGP